MFRSTIGLLTIVFLAANMALAIEDPQRNNEIINGKALIVGTNPNPPYSWFQQSNGTITEMGGYAYDIAAYIAEKHQLTLTFVRSIDGAFGAKKNGTWNGLVGMLHRGVSTVI